MEHLVVVTGGPGSGKTTLIDHLAGLGHGRTVEAGRTFTAMREGYPSCGHETVLLPRASVVDRARFVLETLDRDAASEPL